MKVNYFEIDERTAKAAQTVNSFTAYKDGSATQAYQEEVNRIAELASLAEARTAPERHEHIQMLLDRYAKKYAEYLNKGYRIESYYPSVMITGAGNFNTRKKEKQNTMRDNHYKNYEYFKELENKIRAFGTQAEILKSNDPMILDKLQEEIQELTTRKEAYKAANAYYRKHNNLDGFMELTEEQKQRHLELSKSYNCDYIPYSTTNLNAEIKRLQSRVTEITRLKENDAPEYTSKHCEISEDKDDMRIRLVFDGKPSSEIITLLKKNAFKWSPKAEAWQRQLTSNARIATKRMLQQMEELN